MKDIINGLLHEKDQMVLRHPSHGLMNVGRMLFMLRARNLIYIQHEKNLATEIRSNRGRIQV